jgi:competence protein ComEC
VPHLASVGLVRSAGLVDHMPWLTWRVAGPPWWLLAGYYVAIAACLWRHRYPGRTSPLARLAARLLVACAVGTAVLVVSMPLHSGIAREPGALRVTVLDVGQGDATLLQTPDGRALLVDAGGLGGGRRFDIGERVVAPALWALGVRRLDTLVLTHGDPDHIGGAPAVIAMFGPREVWEGVPVPAHASLSALAGAAAERRTMWRMVRAGDELRLGAVTIRVLHPPAPEWERQRVRNDDSIVLEVRYGDVSVILPGDIGSDIEQALRASLRPAAVRVLKVAHHGSATSTSAPFVEALRPQVAIVSCGRDNRFGHPVPAVLERLQSVGTRVYRTDHHGAVTIETDGKSVRATTIRDHENEDTKTRHEDKTARTRRREQEPERRQVQTGEAVRLAGVDAPTANRQGGP